jgi:stage II sporulation protein D
MKRALFMNALFLSGISLRTFGVPALPGKAVAATFHSNTPIRVLLDRSTQTLSIKSMTKKLYIKEGVNASWREINGVLQIMSVKNKNEIKAYSSHFQGPAQTVFVRGGPYPSDKLSYKTSIYRGALRIEAMKDGLSVTNVLGLDDYLLGTLGREMAASWELEALRTQAVASRTYALFMMSYPKNALYDVEATTQDQVYGGVLAETERVREAVHSTAGQYLSLNHRAIKAYFHSRCGGTTETAQTVWNEKRGEHKNRVACAYCQKNPYVWTSSVPITEFLASLELPASVSKPFSLLPLQKTPSGRISSIHLSSGSTSKKITGDELRNALGYQRIKSTQMKWKIDGDELHFQGVGAGHGVGMCQWGARYLAKQGKTYKEILLHFYPGALLTYTEPHYSSSGRGTRAALQSLP